MGYREERGMGKGEGSEEGNSIAKVMGRRGECVKRASEGREQRPQRGDKSIGRGTIGLKRGEREGRVRGD